MQNLTTSQHCPSALSWMKPFSPCDILSELPTDLLPSLLLHPVLIYQTGSFKHLSRELQFLIMQHSNNFLSKYCEMFANKELMGHWSMLAYFPLWPCLFHAVQPWSHQALLFPRDLVLTRCWPNFPLLHICFVIFPPISFFTWNPLSFLSSDDNFSM